MIAIDGVNLGGTGRVVNGVIDSRPSFYGLTWLKVGAGFAKTIVPVGQFTGQTDMGIELPYLDLIPLKTSSLWVVDSAGNTILGAGADGVLLSGKVIVQKAQGDISMGIYE